MYRVAVYIKDCNLVFVSLISMLLAYIESTSSFMAALLFGFLFNILAGLRADNVKFKMWRLCNFSGHKFKDSLIELLLIIVITYLLKLLADLMHQDEFSVYIVQCLVWVALYNYVRNGLKNLSKAYPNNRWIFFVKNLLSFHFNELMPDSVKKAWEDSQIKKEKTPKNNKIC